MGKQVVFVEGIRAFKPHDKAPSFVKGSLKINRNELMMWLDKQPEEINIDLKESQKGGYYLSVSDYKPTKEAGEAGWKKIEVSESLDDDTDSLPF